MVMKIRTIEIPDRSITREKLEYPTENVSFAYLSIINRVRVVSYHRAWSGIVVTYDVFADKAVITLGQPNDYLVLMARLNTAVDYYRQMTQITKTKEDHVIEKSVGGTVRRLAHEAVDLDTRGQLFAISCNGSMIKGLRWHIDDSPVDPLDPGAPTAGISATDTSFAAGYFGPRVMREDPPHGFADPLATFLVPPMTPLPPALSIIEVESEGDGTPENPYRPLLSKNLVEIQSLTGLPEFLYREAKKYEILKAKGFTDEEIQLLLGYIPQHQVDLDSVTWGAFEFSEKSPTNIIVVTGDNPYQSGAVSRQVELAKGKGLRVLNPPRNYGEAVAQYQRLKRDYPHWLAGKDNYAYQVLGLEELDLFQNIDFYYGELIEHRTHYDQLKRVPDWELWRRLEVLEEKLSKVTVLTEERDRHMKKLKEVKRLGW